MQIIWSEAPWNIEDINYLLLFIDAGLGATYVGGENSSSSWGKETQIRAPSKFWKYPIDRLVNWQKQKDHHENQAMEFSKKCMKHEIDTYG